MDLHEIKALIDAMAASDLAEMELSKDGWTLRLTRGGGGVPPLALPPVVQGASAAGSLATADAAVPLPPNDRSVRAPLFGTVHLSPSPDEPAFVTLGQAVSAGTTLCVIEAMKVFNAVRAERDGTVEAILVASGDEVEAGQPLVVMA